MRGARHERGSVSLFVIACLAMLLLLGSALGVVAAMVRAHRLAQSAADLAALSSAAALARGEDACGAASGTARANGARLSSCRVEGLEVTLVVEVDGPKWLGQVADLSADARAGPA